MCKQEELESYLTACERRRESVEGAMAIQLTATEGPDEIYVITEVYKRKRNQLH